MMNFHFKKLLFLFVFLFVGSTVCFAAKIFVKEIILQDGTHLKGEFFYDSKDEFINVPEGDSIRRYSPEELHTMVLDDEKNEDPEPGDNDFSQFKDEAYQQEQEGDIQGAFDKYKLLLSKCPDISQDDCFDILASTLKICASAMEINASVHSDLSKDMSDAHIHFMEKYGGLQQVLKIWIQKRIERGETDFLQGDKEFTLILGYFFRGMFLAGDGYMEEARKYLSLIEDISPIPAELLREFIMTRSAVLYDGDIKQLYSTLLKYGYMPSRALKISKLIRPLYKNFQITDTTNNKLLIKDIKKNLKKIGEFIWTDNKNFSLSDDALLLYFLLAGDREMEEDLALLFQNIFSNSSQFDLEEVRRLFLCSFYSSLAEIILNAKNLKTHSIYTTGKDLLLMSQPVWIRWLYELDILRLGYTDVDHIASVVALNNNQYIFVDFLNHRTSQPFSMDLNYSQDGNLLVKQSNRNDLWKKFSYYSMRANLYGTLSSLYKTFGYDETAQYLANKAYTLDPENSYLLNAIGAYLFKNGNVSEGIALLEQSTEKNSQHPEAWENLGKAYYRTGNLLKSRQALKKSLILYEAHNDKKNIKEIEGLIRDMEF